MKNTARSMALLTQLARGLINHDNLNTSKQLGDRSRYVGMSDIGKGVECLRAAVAGKLMGNAACTAETLADWHSRQEYGRIMDTLRRRLILQRGHWFEDGIGQALRANRLSMLPQLEIAAEFEGVPIKAHLDFTLVWCGDRPAVRVLEIKSTERIPSTLYSSYETQLYGQLGLLAKCWSLPAFSMRDDDGNSVFSDLTFPDAVRLMFGMELPGSPDSVDIEGWVLCVSMSDAHAFGPYTPDATMLDLCVSKASTIWWAAEAIRTGQSSLDDLDYCKGFHPLCDWCDHADDCPKFEAREVTDPAFETDLDNLNALKGQRSDLDDEISQLEQRIRKQYALFRGDGDWLQTAEHRLKLTRVNGRHTLDRDALLSEITQKIGEQDAKGLLARVTRVGKGYERLFISRKQQAMQGAA